MSSRYNNPRGDALTAVLDCLKMEGRVYCVCDMKSPWAIEETSRRQIYLYVIERGTGKIKFKISEKEITFGGGDLLLISGGEDHIIYNGSTVEPFATGVLFSEESRVRHHLQIDGGGEATTLIGGAFSFKYPDNPHLISALPPLIHIRADDGGEPDNRLAPLLALLFEETGKTDAGAGSVVNNLLEIIFVRTLRIWIRTQKAGPANWLGALRDVQVSRALALLHQNPEKKWTLAGLTSAVGRSKSTFATKFMKLVGEPPISYLAKWRLDLAAGYLRTGEMKVGEAAAKVGFTTSDGFSRSFKKHFGRPPIDFKPK